MVVAGKIETKGESMMDNIKILSPNKYIVKLVMSIVMYLMTIILSALLLNQLGMSALCDNIGFAAPLTATALILPIIYLDKYYKVNKCTNISNGSVMFYIFVGIICVSIINHPYAIISGKHNKPELIIDFMSIGSVSEIVFIIYLVVIGPVLEEIFNRYYSYNIIKDRYGVKIGTIISSFIYMILHGELSLLLFLFGAIFALVYEKTKKIWASMIVHGAMNLIWFTLVYFA